MNIFIAGGTSGIGLALARKYLEMGHRVGICGRNQDKIDNLEKHPLLCMYKFDTYNKPAFEAVVNEFSQGELDIMIASAGCYTNSRTRELSENESVAMLKVNIVGTVNAFEIAREIMLKSGRGHLAAIASVAGLMEYPGASVYSKSKRTVISLCDAYGEALRNFGISVTAIIPGYVNTAKLRELNGDATSKKPFLMSEEYAANIIINSIVEKRERVVFPLGMKIIVALLSKMPKSLLSLFLLRKRILKRNG